MRVSRVSFSDLVTGSITLLAAAMIMLASYRWTHERDEDDAPTIPNWKEIASLGDTFGLGVGSIDVVEFADFECPYCADTDTLLRRLRKDDPSLSVAFVHFPLSSIHPRAYRAAVAAGCAASQGRFEAYHDNLYNHQAALASLSWTKLAEMSALPDTLAFTQCFDKELPRARIERGISEARKIGVKGTPTFIVAGVLLPAGIDNFSLEKAIASRKKRAD